MSEYFKRSEFACKCGCGFNTMDFQTVEWLTEIREHFDAPVKVTSGCRCVTHNAAVGGTSVSQHLLGRACDIQVKGVDPDEVADFAEDIGASGVGRYATFTHIDSRNGRMVRWEG